MFADALQVEMHKKDDVKPTKKVANQDSQPQPKKPRQSLSMDRFKELNNIPKDKDVGEPSKREHKVKELAEPVPPFNIEK
jgi:hypothetical protein